MSRQPEEGEGRGRVTEEWDPRASKVTEKGVKKKKRRGGVEEEEVVIMTEAREMMMMRKTVRRRRKRVKLMPKRSLSGREFTTYMHLYAVDIHVPVILLYKNFDGSW